MIRIICHVLLILTAIRIAIAQGYYHTPAEYNVRIHPGSLVAEREGDDVVLDCRDEGPHRVPIVWTKPDGGVVPTGGDGRIYFRQVRPEQAGRYVCSVSRRKRKGSYVGNASQELVLVVEPPSLGRCPGGFSRCRSGECIPNAQFCDRRSQCADKSDEYNCLRPRKRSGPSRRGIAYYPGDDYVDQSCHSTAWAPCSRNCKQYKESTCGSQSQLYYKWCQHPRVPCGRVTTVGQAVWSAWSEWSACNGTCGHTVRQRTRSCRSTPGWKCEGLPAEEVPCPNIPCPVDGGWSEWTDWTLCTELGSRTRERHCDSPPPLHGGKDCPGVYLEEQECHVCTSTVHLKLTPGRVRCTVGRPTTFVCEYCSDDAHSDLTIDMDTEPKSSKDTPVHENMRPQSWSGPCLRRDWTIKLNNDHHRVSCELKNSEDELVGKVISTIKIRHEGLRRIYTKCQENQITCKDNQCIDSDQYCDGKIDCSDGADESHCPIVDVIGPEVPEPCDEYESYCPTSNLCIPNSLGFDEREANWSSACGKIVTGKSDCRRGLFCCASRQCMTPNCQCDGVNDCGDWSDEIGCKYAGAPRRGPKQILVQLPKLAGESNCYPEEIRCKSTNKCILRTQICDGFADCEDRSDEENCGPKGRNPWGVESRPTTRSAYATRQVARLCKEEEFLCEADKRCLNWAVHWCDGIIDCADGSDEKSCAPIPANASCTEMQFTCSNLQCVPLYSYCDGLPECFDGTDEVDACVKLDIRRECKTDQFKCRSVAACVEKNRECDGKKDCPDGSDEDGCADDLKTNEVNNKSDNE